MFIPMSCPAVQRTVIKLPEDSLLAINGWFWGLWWILFENFHKDLTLNVIITWTHFCVNSTLNTAWWLSFLGIWVRIAHLISIFWIVLIEGKHFHSVMVVQHRKGFLVYAILFLSPTTYLTCDILPTVSISGHHWRNFDQLESWILPPPECTLCMQRIRCIVAKYNFSDGTCQLLPATCPLANDDPAMTYAIYPRVDPEQCLEWIDHYREIPVDARWLLTKIGGGKEKRMFAIMK